MDVLQGGNRPLRPGRYKPRILRFRDMTVAANGENVLAVLWRSPESAARCTCVVLLCFPAKSTGFRQITLVRSSLDSLCRAETALTGRFFGARRNSSMNV
jgi:hypothetical protein